MASPNRSNPSSTAPKTRSLSPDIIDVVKKLKYKGQPKDSTQQSSSSTSSTSTTDPSRRTIPPKKSELSAVTNKITKNASKNHPPITKPRSSNEYHEEGLEQRRRSLNQQFGHHLKLLDKNFKKLGLLLSPSSDKSKNNENDEVSSSSDEWQTEEEEGDIGGPHTSTSVNRMDPMSSTTIGEKKCQPRKLILNKELGCMTTEIPYYVYNEDHIDPELRLSTLLKLDDKKDVEEVVEVPSYREVNYLTKSSSADEEEPTDDATILKRHARPEKDEKDRKRWDARKQREDYKVNKLKERQAERESRKLEKERASNRKKPGASFFEDWSDEEFELLDFIKPKLEAIESILIGHEIPIQVFGSLLPLIEKEEFSLPWTPTRKPTTSLKVQDQEDVEPSTMENILEAILATKMSDEETEKCENEYTDIESSEDEALVQGKKSENSDNEYTDVESSEDEVQVQGKTSSPPPAIASTSASAIASMLALAATPIKIQSNPKPIEKPKIMAPTFVRKLSTYPRALSRLISPSASFIEAQKNSTPEMRELRWGRGRKPIYTANKQSPILPNPKKDMEKFMNKEDESDSSVTFSTRSQYIINEFEDSDEYTDVDEGSSSASSVAPLKEDEEREEPGENPLSERTKSPSPRSIWSKNLRPSSPTISISSVELMLVSPDGNEEELAQINNSKKIESKRSSRNSASRPSRSSASSITP